MIRILPILSLVAGIAAADPYFSEYVEGSSFNKAIELANPGATALDLSGYALRVYFNGNSSPTFNQTLTGSIPPGGVWVLAATNASPALVAAADATTGASLWNGDDALVLVRLPDTVVDSIGQVGVDPGTQWISDGVGTVDRTLRRLVHPSADPDPADPFLPSLGWAGFPIDTFDHIGVSPFANGPDLSLALSPISIAEGGGEVLLTLSRDGGGRAAQCRAAQFRAGNPAGTVDDRDRCRSDRGPAGPVRDRRCPARGRCDGDHHRQRRRQQCRGDPGGA